MRAGLDDLVIALYVTIDELLGPDPRRGRPGRKPRLSDAELNADLRRSRIIQPLATERSCVSHFGDSRVAFRSATGSRSGWLVSS